MNRSQQQRRVVCLIPLLAVLLIVSAGQVLGQWPGAQKLQPKVRVIGVVTDSLTGKPISRAHVEAVSSGETERNIGDRSIKASATTSASGQFSLVQSEDRAEGIVVRKNGYAPRRLERVEWHSTLPDTVRVQLSPLHNDWSRVSIEHPRAIDAGPYHDWLPDFVLDPDIEPYGSLEVRLSGLNQELPGGLAITLSGPGERHARVDDRGKVQLPRLSPGSWVVTIPYGDSSRLLVEDVPIRAAATSRLTLALPATSDTARTFVPRTWRPDPLGIVREFSMRAWSGGEIDIFQRHFTLDGSMTGYLTGMRLCRPFLSFTASVGGPTGNLYFKAKSGSPPDSLDIEEQMFGGWSSSSGRLQLLECDHELRYGGEPYLYTGLPARGYRARVQQKGGATSQEFVFEIVPNHETWLLIWQADSVNAGDSLSVTVAWQAMSETAGHPLSSKEDSTRVLPGGAWVISQWPRPGQGGTIRGTVVDAMTEKPVLGATVHLLSGDLRVEVDDSGRFRLENLAAGDERVMIRAPGYDGVDRELTVERGSVLVVKAFLAARNPSGDE